MIKKTDIIGKSMEDVLSIIDNDIDYTGTTKYYWLSVPTSFDNCIRYIRFPHGKELFIEFSEKSIAKKMY